MEFSYFGGGWVGWEVEAFSWPNFSHHCAVRDILLIVALVQEFPLPPPPKNFKFRIWNARAYQCCAPRQDLIDDIIGPAL